MPVFVHPVLRSHPDTYYVSLYQQNAWLINNGASAGLAPWRSSGSFGLDVPVPHAGQGFRDAGGRFWLYGDLYISGVPWAAYYDFGAQRAVPQWQVSGTGAGGIYSAVSDGGAGFYAISAPSAQWIVHYAGTGSAATATTTSDPAWDAAWDLGTPPTYPFYVNGVVWAIWRQAGYWWALVMGEYNDVWGAGGHVFVNSLWSNGSDPTNAGAWGFVQYLSHYDLSVGSGYWGNWEEQRLCWRQPVTLGTDVFFTTGMNIVGSSPYTPYDTTVVWRMDAVGSVTSDLSMPLPAGTDETWGGPLAVFGGDLYWAQFTFPAAWTWTTDSGTITLWRRHLGVWSVASTWTVPLHNNIYHPMIATMIGVPDGIWLLFDPKDRWFAGSGDGTPTIRTWAAATDTWANGATISGIGEQTTPRIWTG